MKQVIPSILIIFVLLSCNYKNNMPEEDILAEVNGIYLYVEDVQAEILQKNIEAADSVEYYDNFIENWIKHQLLVAEAEKNLNAEKKDQIEKDVEDYREELLIHNYKSDRQLSEENIPFEEIENFYTLNTKNFVLNAPIVQVEYMIFPAELKVPNSFKQKLNSIKEEDIQEREDFIFKFARRYDNFDNAWISFSTFTDRIDPIDNYKRFFNQNNLIEFESGDELHIISIKAYKLPGETAPFEFVAARIENLLLNNKKLYFLREIKDSLYNNALKYNKFKVFK